MTSPFLNLAPTAGSETKTTCGGLVFRRRGEQWKCEERRGGSKVCAVIACARDYDGGDGGGGVGAVGLSLTSPSADCAKSVMPTVAAFPSTSAYSWLCVNFHVEAHRNDDEAAGAGRGSGFRDTGSVVSRLSQGEAEVLLPCTSGQQSASAERRRP